MSTRAPSPTLELLGSSPLQGFLDAAPDGVLVVDEAGRVVLVNEVAERIFGYAREELLGQAIELLVPERWRGAHAEHRRDYAERPQRRPMGQGRELSGRRKDGSEVPVEISLSPLTFDGRTLVISIIRDTTERRQAEAKFRGLLESAPDGIVVVDTSGRITIVNGEAERMFGYSRDELLGQPLEILVPEALRHGHVKMRDGYFERPKTRPMGAGRALTGRRKDGTELPVEISLSPLETEQGLLVMSIVRDITERRHAEEQVKASLHEKEVLLKEIHHRVKNNLQVTSSLLRLQSAAIEDPHVREMFGESQNRIRSMALVHEKLYQSRDLSRIDLGDYARTLGALLMRSFGTRARSIELRVESDEVHVSPEIAVPCGLVLNELLSNALKHAFPGGRSGEVVVSVERADGHIAIAISDDGVGLPRGIDLDRVGSLGLRLIRTLADQLRGEVSFIEGPGTHIRVRFPEATA